MILLLGFDFDPDLAMPLLEPDSGRWSSFFEESGADSSLDESIAEEVNGFRVVDAPVLGGGTVREEQFRVRWAGRGSESDTWETRDSLVGVPEVLGAGEQRFAEEICVARDISDDDMSGDGVYVADDAPSVPRAVRRRSAGWITTEQLGASLADVHVRRECDNGDVDVNGQVFVPPIDNIAAEKFRIANELSECAMGPDELVRMRDRIDLLAMAAKAVPPKRKFREPRNYYEAIAGHNCRSWMQAMDAEMENMEDFGVWELVPMPADKNLMSCRWVFKVKRDINGNVDKMKARLVCRGFTQREGVDYDETWAPTCRMRVFRMLMAEASSDPNVRTAQWDCTAAFLHAPVDYEMFMKQAPGFHKGGRNMVYRLRKIIYGTVQAARLFHKMVREALLKLGAVQAEADECLFIIREGKSWVRVLCHVDDFCCVYNDGALYKRIFAAMQAQFKITDYGGGPLSRFIGVCVERTTEGHYRLHQRPYIEELLERLGLEDGRHARTPERSGTAAKLRTRDLTTAEKEYMSSVPFREAVGALFYLCRGTRFDIAHAVSEVARFMGNPAPEHWEAVLRIYHYLARTKDVALLMSSRGMHCEVTDQLLEGFSDSDWAGCPDTRRSHTGWIIRVGGSLVSWYSKRQSGISQSTTEAEYVAAAAVANEVIWWRRLCNDLGYESNGPVTVWCDNRAATSLAKHAGNFEAAKHIQLRYHVLRHYQNEGLIRVRWRRSDSMWADILTKNCAYSHFERIVNALMGEDLPLVGSARGRPRK